MLTLSPSTISLSDLSVNPSTITSMHSCSPAKNMTALNDIRGKLENNHHYSAVPPIL